MKQKDNYLLFPIGFVSNGNGETILNIYEEFRPALKQLNQFSHVNVLWWANQHDNEKSRNILQTKPPYAKKYLTGVFATRSEYRPNPIAITTCKIIDCDDEKGTIRISKIDAFNGTPIIDLKAYFPVCDRVKNPGIPQWLSFWPEWMPEEELGLQ
jgi:tRNA-Thr(GGU) m(6)t(6)A37 methyltransferase TsaA